MCDASHGHTNFSLPHGPLIAHRPPLTAHRSPPTAHRSPPTARRSPLTVQPPSDISHQLNPDSALQTSILTFADIRIQFLSRHLSRYPLPSIYPPWVQNYFSVPPPVLRLWSLVHTFLVYPCAVDKSGDNCIIDLEGIRKARRAWDSHTAMKT